MNFTTPTENIEDAKPLYCGLDELRRCLHQLGSWPEAGDEYLSLFTSPLWDRVAIREQDYEWISKVAIDAQKGIDIGLRYPSFFQKLVANSKLRTVFINRLKRQP